MARRKGNWIEDTLYGFKLLVVMGLASIVVVPVLVLIIAALVVFG